MKKNQIYQGRVTEKITFGGKAKVEVEAAQEPEDNGRLVAVKNVIPGQKIKFRLKRQEKGDFTELIEKSSLETEAVCPIFGECGGCVYLSMDYEAQLSMKLNMVRDLFDDDDICRKSLSKIYPSPMVRAYRNKMEYSFGDSKKGGELTLGLHKRSSRHDVLTADECLLVHDDCNKIVGLSLDFFRKEKISYYHKREMKGLLRHLVIRRSESKSELLITLVTTSQFEGINKYEMLSSYINVLKNADLSGNIAGVLHTVNDSLSDTVKDEGTEVLFGRDYITEEVLGLEFKITPFSFFQTNSKGAEVLYSVAREYALEDFEGKGDAVYEKNKPVIFDLYSGTGTIAQIMAPVAKKVIGVEIVEEAVKAAFQNAAMNGLDNCSFLAGDVLKALDDIDETPDFIILDPPRDGVHPKALEKILAYGVKNILYISCKPTSLVRDLAVCRSAGYEVRKMCCVDMFPGTGHVETVVSLYHQKRKYIDIEVNVDEMATTGAEMRNLATYEEIKKYCADRGVKVTTLYITQVKHKMGLPMRPNYRISKNESYKQPQCPPDKEKVIIEALKHFKMI